MFQPLDGPSKQGTITVDTVTVKELKIGASALDERKVITLQPAGKIRVYFGDGTGTPSAATIAADGIVHFKNQKESYEASETQPVFILSELGSTDVVVVERA